MEGHSIGSIFSSLHIPLLAIDTRSTTLLVILLLCLLVLSFVISGAEIAIIALEKKDINLLKTKSNPAAKRVINLLEEPKEVYASMMMAGIFINICIVVIANFLITSFVNFGHLNMALVILIKVLAIAFVLIFFAKILPKVWSTQHSIWFAYGASTIVLPLHLLLRRVSRVVLHLVYSVGEKAGANKTDSMSMQELDKAIDAQVSETASVEDRNIMKGIVKFGNTTVKQIMRSRIDVSGIDYSLTFSAVIKLAEALHYSRLPVYKNNLDEVVGMIYTKDLIPFLQETDSFDWHSLMRKPYFVPEQKLIEDLLKDFQQNRIHFAVVVDEFGGTSGIATMEDVLEEVIGDIKDEFDEEENENRKIDDNNYIFNGKVMMLDLCRIMHLPIDTFDEVKGESESLGGMILELAGELPAKDAVIHCGDFDFKILGIEKNRIQLVKVTIKPHQLYDENK